MDWRSLWLRFAGSVAVLVLCGFMLSGNLLAANGQVDSRTIQTSGIGPSIQLAQYYYYPNYPYPQVRRKKRIRRYRAAPGCTPPWKYSSGLRRCICVQEGFSVSNGKCMETAKICPRNAIWSNEQNGCECEPGFTDSAGECIDPTRGVVTYAPSGDAQCLWPRVKSEEDGGCVCSSGYRGELGQCILNEVTGQDQKPRARPDELLTSDVTTVQQCLKEAGYLRTAVTSSMNRAAWTAFWFFKQDHAVGRTPKGIHEPVAQHRLFTLCPIASSQLAAAPPGKKQPENGQTQGSVEVSERLPNVPAHDGQNVASSDPEAKLPAGDPITDKPKTRKVYAKPEAGCLPDDLHRLIVDTYGPRPSLAKCARTCIAKPAGITKRESSEFETMRGIRWCNACIEIGSSLPLEDILKIERGANVQVCTRPPSRLPKWVVRTDHQRPSFTRVRKLFNSLPRNDNNKDSFAVVIGNSAYGKGVPKNASASASASAFQALLSEHLGFEQENIVDLREASFKDMQNVFGKAGSSEGELARRVAASPDAKIFIYYAGHAMTRADGGESYLLPVDTVKYREERSGYPLSQLYENLKSLGSKSVLMMIEADFGRDLSNYVYPPNLPEMQVSALPAKPLEAINVLVAADGDQRTLDDPEFGIGLFTRYLIEGLAGRADLASIGNGDGKIDTVELYAYISHMVRLSARKSFGLLQKPMMSRSENLRVSDVQAPESVTAKQVQAARAP